MTSISRGTKATAKLKSMGNHDEFLNRITKSLYYTKLPMTDCLSLPVTELAAELFTEVKSSHTLERLDVEQASRISRNACVSPCSLVLALLYLERLKDCNPEYLQRVAPSELFLVSLMVASKFLNDDGEEDEVFNGEWAQSGALSVSHMNQLEKEFLRAIDWSVFVHDGDFWDRLLRLEKDIAYREGHKRGWFSYTELSCLMSSVQLAGIAQAVINVSSICLATYAAGVATLVGSALVASYCPGSALSARQPPTPGNLTEADLSQLAVSQPPGQAVSEELLPEFDPAIPCNQTHQDCEGSRNDAEEGWAWWMESVMTWLPEYSGLDPNGVQQEEEESNVASQVRYLLNQPVVIGRKEDDDYLLRMKWRRILGVDLNLLLHDWSYYVTKISVGHQH